MSETIYIQFAPAQSVHGGETIRKWSREPFDGGEPFVRQVEYICKCGLRVEPHRCRDTDGLF
jgi:hypothetical protein